jgi:transposase-like protein
MKTRRQYTRDLKIAVVRDIEMGKSLAQVSRENGIHPSLIAKWKREYFENPENAFRGNGKAYKEQARMAELEEEDIKQSLEYAAWTVSEKILPLTYEISR